MVKATHNPALQERPERVNVLGVNLTAHVFASAMPHGVVLVVLIQIPITGMLIGRNQRNVISDCRAHKAVKRGGVRVLDDLGDNHSLASDSADHSNLASGSRVSNAIVPVSVLALATNESFIDFDFPSKRNEVALHGRSPAVAHIPACAVRRTGIFTEDHAVNLQRGNALLADKHQITDLEPQLQGNLGVLENGSSDNRESVAVASAAIFVLAEPVKRTRLQRIDSLAGIAARAMD